MSNLAHKVCIYQNLEDGSGEKALRFEGGITDAFGVQLGWEWTGLTDMKFMNSLQKGAAALKEFSEGVGFLEKGVAMLPKNTSAGTSLTRMIGGYPDYLRPSVSCRLYIQDSISDIYNQLNTLHKLASPLLSKNISTFENMVVSVFIGNFFYMEQAAIISVSETFSKTFVMGHPSWCDVMIQFQSVKVADRALLETIFTPITVKKA